MKLKKTWTEHVNNDETLKKMVRKNTLLLRMKKKDLGNITRKEGLYNLTTTGQSGHRIKKLNPPNE